MHGIDVVNALGTLVIVTLTFAAVVTEKLPRTTALLLGAALAVAWGTVRGRFYTAADAASAVSVSTLVLLVTMGVLAAVLERAGAFRYLAVVIARATGGRRSRLLLAIGMATYAFSLIANNLTVVVIMGALTIGLLERLRINPRPYLVAVLISSNTGGASTAIGDFPNLVIAERGHIQFLDFLQPLGMFWIVLVLQIVSLLFIRWQFRHELADPGDALGRLAVRLPVTALERTRLTAIRDRRALISGVAGLAVALGLFATSGLHGMAPLEIALAVALTSLALSGLDQEQLIDDLGLRTLLAFLGLFVIAGAVERTGAIAVLGDVLLGASGGRAEVVLLMMPIPIAVATALVDAGPTTAVFVSLVASLESQLGVPGHLGFWALSIGVLAGSSATILGATAGAAAASMMDAYVTRRDGVTTPSGFPGAFSRTGIPVALLMALIGMAFLHFAYGWYVS